MKTKSLSNSARFFVSTASSLVLASSASAHTSYGGVTRDLGPSNGTTPGVISGASPATPYFKTLQTSTTTFGWAHGTEAQFGDAHDIKAFRFTLAEAGYATIQAAAAPGIVGLLPAFSLYSGLLHTSGGSDYDTSLITQAYLQTLGNPQPRRGAFDALHTWKIGNDTDLSTLAYMTNGNAADGTNANFGSATGINGDGVADGSVTGSYWLPAGDYTLIVGGANLTGTTADGNLAMNVSLSVIPEPSVALLGVFASGCLILRRRRD